MVKEFLYPLFFTIADIYIQQVIGDLEHGWKHCWLHFYNGTADIYWNDTLVRRIIIDENKQIDYFTIPHVQMRDESAMTYFKECIAAHMGRAIIDTSGIYYFYRDDLP